MGSGKLIKRAINKYGIDNFSKEYLGIYDTEKKMNLAEKIFVVIDIEVSYNLCNGGKGGFGYINSNDTARIFKNQKARIIANNNGALELAKTALEIKREDKEWYQSVIDKQVISLKSYYETNSSYFKGKVGTESPNFGLRWITDGNQNKKIKKDDMLPNNWRFGRTVKNPSLA